MFPWAEDSARAGTMRQQGKLAKAYDGLLVVPPAASGMSGGAAAAEGTALDAKRATLKALVRRGIPPELRPSLWLLLSGGRARQAQQKPDFYTAATKPDPEVLPAEHLYALEEDLQAAVRGNAYFHKREAQAALRRLMLATAQSSPQAGAGPRIRPGLGCMAAAMLAVMSLNKEEEAFWTLNALLEDRAFCCHGQAVLDVKVEQKVLDKLVQKKLPKVHTHFKRMDMKLSSLTYTWISSLFATILPAETLARVWDCLICEGSKILQRVLLALLKKYEATVLGCGDVCHMRKILEARSSCETDADALLSVAFKGIGTLASSCVAELRQSSVVEVEEQILEHQKKLDFIICGTMEGQRLMHGGGGGVQHSLQQVM